MAEGGAVATLHLSNATAEPLFIWLEPWVDELWLPPRSQLTLHTVVQGAAEWPEVEGNADAGLTIWGVGGSILQVEINGEAQDTLSARHTAPGFGALTPRKFVETAFGALPRSPAWWATQAVAGQAWLAVALADQALSPAPHRD